MTKTFKIKDRVLTFLLAISLLLFSFFCQFILIISTQAESVVTPVLEDLQKDSSFNTKDYPTINDDFSLKVISVAETTSNELLVYVYQPSVLAKRLIATSINISKSSDGKNPTPNNYTLSLINSNGVFQKYLVNNFTVNEEPIRYYEIPSIFRKWEDGIDARPSEGQTINEVSFEVAKRYIVTTNEDNSVEYTCDKIDTITITDKFVGYVRYITSGTADHNNWLSGLDTACDRHFVAFTTDREIDTLIEAEVTYQTQLVNLRWLSGDYLQSEDYGTPEDLNSYLTIDDKNSVTTNVRTGLFTTRTFTYNWSNIQTVLDFIDSIELSNTYEGAIFNTSVQTKITGTNYHKLLNKQWVLTFDNTDYVYDVQPPAARVETYTAVSNVTILRLKFKTGDSTYNLGVIDNKQTGSNEPINETIIKREPNIVIGTLIKALISTISLVIITIIILLIVLIISLPIKLIIYLVRRARK